MFARYAQFALVSFVLHFVWEAAHIHLYTAYEALGSGVPLLLWATVGDTLYACAGIAIVGVIARDFRWLQRPTLRHYVLAALYGFIVAIVIEWKALIFLKWAYTTAMPIIPLLRVGLFPVLQMTILVPLCAYLTFLWYRKYNTM